MPLSLLKPVVDQVRSRAVSERVAGLSDGELLDLYVESRDEIVFEALVKRHGPMVLATCGRVLRLRQDAEDAFQATFLVLVHKAGTIRPREMVGHWLYGVAYKAALKVRTASARRLMREKPMSQPPETTCLDRETLYPYLDRALHELPEKLRLPIVLCYLEGKSRRDAARQLGWPEGTVAGRIAEGRALLAKKLIRQGIVVSAATLTVLLEHTVAATSVPGTLVAATVNLASQVATSLVAKSALSHSTANLYAEEIVKSIALSKAKVWVIGLLAISMLAVGGTLLHGTQTSDETPVGTKPTQKERSQEKPAELAKLSDLFQGTWNKVGSSHDGIPNALFANDEPYLTFKKDQFEVTDHQNRTVKQGSFSVNPTENVLDLMINDGKDKGVTQLARYEFKDQMLHLAYHSGKGKRPVEMLTTPGSGVQIFRYRRVDPTTKSLMGWSSRLGTPNWRLGETVLAAALSPDGKLLAAGGATRLRIFNAKNGVILHDLKDYRRAINALTFSPNGKTLLASSTEGTLTQWNVESGEKQLALVKDVRGVNRAAYSPDGKIIAVGVDAHPDHYLALLNAETGTEMARLKIDAHQVAFSPDGKWLATTGAFDRRAFLIDLAKQTEVGELTATGALVNDVAFSPDSLSLVTDPGYLEAATERTLVFWDVATAKVSRKLMVPNAARTRVPIVFSADGQTLYSGRVAIDSTTGKAHPVVGKFEGEPMASTAGGQLLATQHLDSGVICVYDRITGQERTPGMGHRGSVMAVVYLEDLNAVVTFGKDQLRAVWKASERGFGESTETVGTAQSRFALSGDSRIIAISSSSNEIALYEVAKGKLLKTLKSGRLGTQAKMILSPDGALLALTSWKRSKVDQKPQWRIELIDTAKDAMTSAIALDQNRPTALAFSPDAGSIAVANMAGKIQILDIATGKLGNPFELKGPAIPIHAIEELRFAPDGKTLVSSGNSAIIWDVATGKELRRVNSRFGPVQFSPDGKLFASVDEHHAIWISDAKTGEKRGWYGGHTAPLRSLAFSKDGTRLYSGSDDTLALIWDLQRP